MGKRINHFIDTYVVFDLETTGLSCYEHEIIEIGAIKVENNRVVDTYSSFVKPKNNIPYFITKINGITNQMVRNAPGIDSALTEFLEFTGESPLLGHNIISFDMKFINVVSEELYGAGVHNDYIDSLLERMNQQEEQVRDSQGRRWVKCEFCGKIALESKFSSYGGMNHINLGICYECQKNNPEAKIIRMIEPVKKAKIEVNKCPYCGGDLKEKIGKFGQFVSCSNYPNCRYTRNIK